MRLTLQVSRDDIIKYGFIGLFFKGTITDFFSVLCIFFLGKEIPVISNIVLGISVTLLFIGIVVLLTVEYKFLVSSFLICLVTWVLSGIFHQETVELLKSYSTGFFMTSLPYMWFMYYFFDCRDNSEKKENNIRFIFKLGIIRTIVCIISQTMMFINPSADIYNDYMVNGYALLIPAVYVLAFCIYSETKRILPRLLVIISVVFLLMIGCRGPLVIYMGFWIICQLVNIRNNALSVSYFLKRVAILVPIILIIIFAQPVAETLISMGVESRSISKIAEGSMFQDSIRLEIYGLVIGKIKANPWGWGILSDRIIIPQSGLFWDVIYTHNIILELMLDFGVTGLLVFLFFTKRLIRVIRIADAGTKLIVLATMSVSLFRLMISSSLWVDQMLYALIGIILIEYKTHGRKYRNDTAPIVSEEIN